MYVGAKAATRNLQYLIENYTHLMRAQPHVTLIILRQRREIWI